jgi:hypothetical protein
MFRAVHEAAHGSSLNALALCLRLILGYDANHLPQSQPSLTSPENAQRSIAQDQSMAESRVSK